MAAAKAPRPMRILVRNLVLSTALGIGLFLLFLRFNAHFFNNHGINPTEFLALEAGAILLVAWAVARSVTSATNAVLERQGIASRGHAVRLFINILIAIAAVLALFDLAGVSAESIFLGSAFAGIIIGLAAQTVLANVFSGLLLVISDPYRPGDRVTFVTSSYGALAPSYPHELMYPGYNGTIRDVGLIYTVVELDGGGVARFPNAIVMTALSVQRNVGAPHAYRVRMTFPQSVGVAVVENAVGKIAENLPGESPANPAPKLEVTDISEKTWDGVVVIWSTSFEEGRVRDLVLRSILGKLPGTPSPAETARRPAP
jgi:small-conductance mechanosensitive channel